jgi:hypothetical protein
LASVIHFATAIAFDFVSSFYLSEHARPFSLGVLKDRPDMGMMTGWLKTRAAAAPERCA